MTTLDFTLRLLAAIGGGFFIGFERQWNNKAAGLRTNTLVATGSALYVLLSLYITQEQGDVTRIMGQVVTGIGFLGAGIIFKEGISIKGLTTAATVWCSSAIGSIAAAGLFKEALIGVIAIILINTVLISVDKWISTKSKMANKDE